MQKEKKLQFFFCDYENAEKRGKEEHARKRIRRKRRGDLGFKGEISKRAKCGKRK